MNIKGGFGGASTSSMDFSYEESAPSSSKTVMTIHGDKGDGKTTMAMSMEGTVYCISLDNKSMRIKEGVYKNDARIHVIDGLKYFIDDEQQLLDSAVKTYDWIVYCIGEIAKKGDCDWIMIDGLERMSYILEMKMRCKHKMGVFAGVSNPNVWKDRKLYLRHIHRMMLETAKKGIVYSTYSKVESLMDDNGVEFRKKVPSWLDIVMEETDIVIRADAVFVGGKRIFLAKCESSKREDMIPTGAIINVTGTGLKFGKENQVEYKEVK